MRVTTFIIGMLAALSIHADLDRIDADGVTETGGETKYARMLPRTGSDGRLSPTLLPPVADWASQPIAGLYYAASGATAQGNGSPQYPFNTLTYALTNMTANSALILAPGDYSGTVSIASGQSITLIGVGAKSRITRLTVTAIGSSADTTLDLCGLTVSTLTVSGGRVNIRLVDTTINALAGIASDATVTRTDMASRIGVSTLTHVDTYTGASFVSESGAVVSPDGARRITLSGGRGVVVDGATTNVLAHTGDIDSATGAVYTAIASLEDADAETVALVSTERTERSAADQSLSNSVMQAVSTLSGDISTIGTTWSTRLSAIDSRITAVNTALVALGTKQSNDVTTLNTAISASNAGYAAADTLLATTLRGEVADSVSRLREYVPYMAETQAVAVVDAKLRATTNAVIASAVAQATSSAVGREAVISGRVSTVQAQLSSLQTRVSTNTTKIAALSVEDTRLRNEIASAKNEIGAWTNRIVSLETAVSSLNTWAGGVNSWRNSVNTDIATIENRIDSTIESLASLTNAVHKYIGPLPDKFNP